MPTSPPDGERRPLLHAVNEEDEACKALLPDLAAIDVRSFDRVSSFYSVNNYDDESGGPLAVSTPKKSASTDNRMRVTGGGQLYCNDDGHLPA